MKHTGPLHALFAALVTSCGGTTVPTGGSGASGGQNDSGSTSATATVTATTVGTSTTGMNPTTDQVDGLTLPDDGCDGDIDGQETYSDIPLSQLAPWIDEQGEVTDCWAACQAAGLDQFADFLSCSIHYPDGFPGGSTSSTGDPSTGGMTSTGSSTGTGEATSGGSGPSETGTSSTTGSGEDPLVDLTCSWSQICGRGHAGLRSDGSNHARDPVGRWAAKAAHAEAASVPAFLHLVRELAAHGAPHELRAEAERAARDEVVHTSMMTQLARGRGAEPPTLAVDPVPLRSLEALAIENAVEGCVRETWAALEAHHQATHAEAQDLRTAMRRIAVDEARHAELARRIDAWCRSQLDDAAWARVEVARAQAIRTLRAQVGMPRQDLARATGVPTGPAARRLFDGLHASLWA